MAERRSKAHISSMASIAMLANIATVMPDPAQAADCGPATVTARGEESRFVWLAKTKARANWRRTVRSTPGLGPDYSNWARAENTEERCLSGPASTVCIFTGVPCTP
jgi:hypothetical protein